MVSKELVTVLTTGSIFKFSEVKEMEIGPGIYSIFDKGSLVYVGISATDISDRVGRQHGSGNSTVSSFCNYIRSEKGLAVTTEEAREFTELAPVKIEELKVQDYCDNHVRVRFAKLDPSALLEDVDKKPEDFLLREHFPSLNVKLLNFGTKRSEKVTLDEYRERMKLK